MKVEKKVATVYLSLGSNLGQRYRNFNLALKELEKLNSVKLRKKSAIYETEPIGFKAQRYFLNAVIEIRTSLPPLSLFYLLKGIERKMGRDKGKRWGPRRIDLDMLLYNNMVIRDDKLILPHSQMHKRRFVLLPLLELNSRLRHPVLNLTFKELLGNIKGKHKVRLVKREWKS